MTTPAARLALTLGDPRGIGPEVVEKALDALALPPERFVIVGPAALHGRFPDHETVASEGSLDEPGKAAGSAIERAHALVLEGRVGGIVTAPIHKPALVEAGYDYPGHTEMLMELARVPQVGMLMCEEGSSAHRPAKRVLLATTHVPLSAVPRLVTTELLVSQCRLLDRALRDDWGIDVPRIALCALNPHASDGGLFGSDERDRFDPAVIELQEGGVAISGPLPADTVFRRAFDGAFDAVVAPYHDVGMAAFKTAAFGQGVNVTIGLPFIRTSPDHGTAFDIAGQGVADPGSMVEAIRLATRLATHRRGVDPGSGSLETEGLPAET